jgi:uncharacterized membrane protein YoaK (UPF0700 family)
MQAAPQSSRVKAESAVALLLTFAAGLVDIVGFITLYHSFVAHMTGTTVHLDNRLVLGDWTQAAKAATVIASFVIGFAVGRAIIELGVRFRQRKVATISLSLRLLWSLQPLKPIRSSLEERTTKPCGRSVFCSHC